MNPVGLTLAGSFIWQDGYGRISSQLALGALDRGWDLYLMDINEKVATKKYAHPFISEHYDALSNYNNTQFQHRKDPVQ